MSMRRRWVAECDEPGCDVVLVLDVIPDGDRWDYGIEMNDQGWDTGPGRDETFCPEHLSEAWKQRMEM